MKYQTATLLVTFYGLASAAPFPAPAPKNGFTFSIPRAMLRVREVPQEHSHEKFLTGVRAALNLNNPAGIQDPVFGLLGNAAAAAGAGSITNLDCLHQATADQAFTNAKAAGDVQGMSDSLMYAALERNTGKVGLASVICTDPAVNPEIQAVQQHQDPASTGAAAGNKAVVLALAQQLASIGADPQLALQSGTFAPGDLADNTGKGNTCDTTDDPEGCIFTQNLLVEDATAAEISAAAAGSGAATGGAVAAPSSTDVTASSVVESACPAPSTINVDPPAATEVASTTEAVATATPTATSGTNVQTFNGSLGGPPPPVESSTGDRPFSVNGDTFVNASAALQRSCAVQHNACANAVNGGTLTGVSVGDCGTQESDCNAAAA